MQQRVVIANRMTTLFLNTEGRAIRCLPLGALPAVHQRCTWRAGVCVLTASAVHWGLLSSWQAALAMESVPWAVLVLAEGIGCSQWLSLWALATGIGMPCTVRPKQGALPFPSARTMPTFLHYLCAMDYADKHTKHGPCRHHLMHWHAEDAICMQKVVYCCTH